jgi:sugar lactone lactonase YvrE
VLGKNALKALTPAVGLRGDAQIRPSPALRFPLGLAIDPQRRLYIADRDNHRVLRCDLQTSTVSIVLESQSISYARDKGELTVNQIIYPEKVTVDNDNLYFTDGAFPCVRAIDLRKNVVRVVAGQFVPGFMGDDGAATKARLKVPSGLVLDQNGNLFIADSFNNRVRRVDKKTSTITTVAGTGAPERDIRELDRRL